MSIQNALSIDWLHRRSNTFVECLLLCGLAATSHTLYRKLPMINKIWNWHYFLISRLIYVPLITDCRRNQIDLSCFFRRWLQALFETHVGSIFKLKFVFKWMEKNDEEVYHYPFVLRSLMINVPNAFQLHMASNTCNFAI